jgi:predicted dehydrogenase
VIYAVVGVGTWGLNHARVGAELRDAGVVDRLVCCDADPERAASVAAEFGGRPSPIRVGSRRSASTPRR